jgi:hypothetical protein
MSCARSSATSPPREDNLPWLFVSERQAPLTAHPPGRQLYRAGCWRERNARPRLAAHAAPFLRLLPCRPGHRPADHVGRSGPPGSQAHRSLHPCCRASVRRPVEVSASARCKRQGTGRDFARRSVKSDGPGAWSRKPGPLYSSPTHYRGDAAHSHLRSNELGTPYKCFAGKN